jgi:uncharacterized protein
LAGSSLLTLIDDIATLLDDVSVMTKVAAKKTAGVLGDDLALNAQQVSGVNADRELPVVWAVAKGSLKNKLILVPAALATSALAPWAITPLLMIGGAYLCFEGFEKLAHKFLHSKAEDQAKHDESLKAMSNPKVDLVAYEKEKIQGAIRTDFILSAEIIVIALGSVKDAPFASQAIVVASIAGIMTVGVYGIVAAIVKLDDAGLYLVRTGANNAWFGIKRRLGKGILHLAPYLMKTLSTVGTIAMFMVGGGILLHGLPQAHELLHYAEKIIHGIPAIGTALASITPILLSALAGVLAGAILLVIATLATTLNAKLRSI